MGHAQECAHAGRCSWWAPVCRFLITVVMQFQYYLNLQKLLLIGLLKVKIIKLYNTMVHDLCFEISENVLLHGKGWKYSIDTCPCTVVGLLVLKYLIELFFFSLQLDVAPDYDERCRIRSAIRSLKKAATTSATTTTTATTAVTSKDRNGNVHRSSTFTSCLPSVQISSNKLPQSHTQTRSNSFTVKNGNHSNSLAHRKWGKHISDVTNDNGGSSPFGAKTESVSISERNNVPRKSYNVGTTRYLSNVNSSQKETSKRAHDYEDFKGEKTRETIIKKAPPKTEYEDIQDENELTNLVSLKKFGFCPLIVRTEVQYL